MNQTTKDIILLATSNDKTIAQGAVSAAIQILSGTVDYTRLHSGGDNPTARREILSRKQVADMIGKSTTTVDLYARRGVFKRVYLSPSTRLDGTERKKKQAQGFTRESVMTAIQCGL